MLCVGEQKCNVSGNNSVVSGNNSVLCLRAKYNVSGNNSVVCLGTIVQYVWKL